MDRQLKSPSRRHYETHAVQTFPSEGTEGSVALMQSPVTGTSLLQNLPEESDERLPAEKGPWKTHTADR